MPLIFSYFSDKWLNFEPETAIQIGQVLGTVSLVEETPDYYALQNVEFKNSLQSTQKPIFEDDRDKVSKSQETPNLETVFALNFHDKVKPSSNQHSKILPPYP